ncbi:MAG TPA: apolipoprotein N-acyltransferase, partial [Pirellulaceae bacterium]|nr:apolipoprotein N-acyltransferase [Pirellulaceae bacterium]
DAPPERFVETCRTYQLQARDLALKHPDLDVMIWPESMFMSFFPQYLLDEDATVPEGWPYDATKLQSEVGARQHDFDVHVSSTLKAINGRDENGQPQRNIAQIVGTATYHFQKDKVGRYNAALAISPEGQIAGHYYKMHPVMFGEYIPLGEALPWIYRFTPMPEGLTRGKAPAEFEVAGYKLAPSICFESTVPHLIRRQINTLAARGEAPDVLVNVTNDGWFWGSGILDLHYNCAVFRAVENHRPMLVAANTGFSVAVDGRGQVLSKGPRRAPADLVVEVSKDGRHSLYTQWGDWPLLGFLSLGAVAGLILNRRPRT